MHTDPIIGEPAPELQLKRWVQGETSLPQQLGKVVLIEVFQVNCPGCFVHALPEINRLHETYTDQGLSVIGLATAFEDYDRNTEENLIRFLETRQLIGDPLEQLGKAGVLDDQGRVDFGLAFPIAVDDHETVEPDTSTETVREFILQQIPDFDAMPEDDRAIIIHNARDYLSKRTQRPLTFSRYRLEGTPSSILIDREGRLRDVSFGWVNHLEPVIQQLLKADNDG